ncbi:GerAB/ArcD/ProY family transporter [Paenibacillus sp. ACRRY]|uniref:GerAB/ArcD/ProY family transporter n=1 Tax=Paenibacillus sp. ACRRY TaxID=2918208 RepID=UPI001EF6CB4F|nr:GerAB/ArcD/ProY family transporter [Paenibacillus sp. ACRRY]MCG7382074.1 spore germination protein [Paenibacillus sp. ACRRY]
MKESGKDLSLTQATVTIINAMLGAGILTLPRTVGVPGGTPDAWISLMFSGLVFIGIGWALCTLCMKFPGKTVYEFASEITGKWIAYVLGLAIILYFLISSAFEIRVMAEVTSMYLLEGTPQWAIVMAFMWIGIYMITGGLDVMIRVFEIILPITLVIFVIEILFASELFELNNLRPLLGDGVMPLVKDLRPALMAYNGFEVMIVINAYVKNPKESRKAMVWGISISMMFYLVTFLMVVGSLSLDGVKSRSWPTLDLVRSYEIEGLIFERFESWLLVIWIMQIFSTFGLKHYCASRGIVDLFRLPKKFIAIVFLLIPVVYLIAMIPHDVNGILALGDLLGDSFILLFGAIPLVLLLLTFIRKKGEGQA